MNPLSILFTTMALQRGPTYPTNVVYLRGPAEKQEAVADGAVTPGAVLMNGTADDDVKEADAAATINWVGVASDNDWIEHGSTAANAANTDQGSGPGAETSGYLEDFADGEELEYHAEPGVVVNCILDESETLDWGDAVVASGTGGMVQEYGGNATHDPAAIVGKYVKRSQTATAAGESARVPIRLGGAA